MHALQRVQRSRSIGFSCSHDASKAPSHPARPVSRPLWTGNARSAGSSAPGGAARDEHRDGELRCEHLRPVQRRLGGTRDQHLALRRVRDARHGLGIGHSGQREERGDLGRRAFRFGRPPARLADVDEADRLRLAALLRNIAEERRLLRAGDHDIPRGVIGKPGELLLAEHRVHQRLAAQFERARERRGVEPHRAVARAKMERLVAEAHRRAGSTDGFAAGTDSPLSAASPEAGVTASGDTPRRHIRRIRCRCRVAGKRQRRGGFGGRGLGRVRRRNRDVDDEAVLVDARRRRVEEVARLREPRDDVRRDGIGLRIVVDVGVETVHHVEARIAEQLAQRLMLQAGLDVGAHERREIGVGGQRVDTGQRVRFRFGGRNRCRRRGRDLVRCRVGRRRGRRHGGRLRTRFARRGQLSLRPALEGKTAGGFLLVRHREDRIRHGISGESPARAGTGRQIGTRCAAPSACAPGGSCARRIRA